MTDPPAMRPVTVLVLSDLVVAFGGIAVVALDGELAERWISDTARNNSINHHAVGVGPDGDVIVAESIYGRTYYFTPEYDAWERDAIAVLGRETAREIPVDLLDRGEATPNSAADAPGIARSTLE